MQARGNLLSIQYLRGIAALMVVAYHCFSYGMVAGFARDAAIWLKQGVAIFFVISGYVMVLSTSGAGQTPASFLWRRVLRIAPLYWLTTAFLFAVGLRGMDAVASIPCSLLFLPCLAAGTYANSPPILDVGWTLVVEMFFYAVFAATMVLPRKWSIGVTCGVLAALSALSFVWPDVPVVEVYSHPRLLEFVAGMLLAHFKVRFPPVALPAGVALLCTFGSALQPEWHSLCVSLPAILIVGGALGLEGRLPRIAALNTMGDASYAIYLVHYIVFNRLVLPIIGYPAPMAAILPAALSLSVLVGVLVHRTIEKPLNEVLLRRFGKGMPIPAKALAIAQ